VKRGVGMSKERPETEGNFNLLSIDKKMKLDEKDRNAREVRSKMRRLLYWEKSSSSIILARFDLI
jgi:hypothetical protein